MADAYKMDYEQRGLAVIINNREFHRELGLGPRTGTDQDAAALHQRFTEMGFDVDVYVNQTVRDMLQILTKGWQSNTCFAFLCSKTVSQF